jgi:hypothetical protein
MIPVVFSFATELWEKKKMTRDTNIDGGRNQMHTNNEDKINQRAGEDKNIVRTKVPKEVRRLYFVF